MIEKLKKEKIVAIFRKVPFEELLPQVDLLIENGITIMEVTLDSPSALNSLYELKKRYGKDIHLGAGTVMKAEDVARVNDIGAEFIISPHVDIEVIQATKELGLTSIPGAFTPTEIATAYQHGADMIKIFPASTLGAEYVKNLKGPFSSIPFMATGGINEHNAKEFLESGYTSLGVGSSLTSIGDGDLVAFKHKVEAFTSLQVK
ncbi:bifunctional 4-hydroxy-2-oxoglutarate aldolase/2-dehydro-3-deoxy-phosphogluconate aldolase [Rossellomorea sp. BNER]|uniref:bifunctional 4-hydroxy-2-oxoglutarate aldolase/2-dehydro-3-deoxy-phosphogluconate aldolase n=1 Tax=Rossellomorea sp. BNER TaxID=2962031 RepID=UPI003AF1F9DE|nr:bifunctional 4-hydroxy-2-oxoglutarate aldolase/2-dehydro-3-deoxy-phosphogluconate aldolase [Rossellomorea sp. BNER]